MKKEPTTHQRRPIQLRLELIDELLSSNTNRNYEAFLNALNKALVIKGELGISERTLKYDIAHLVDKKGAPIHRPTKADPFLYYESHFSIKDLPITEEEVGYLRSAIDILKQVDNFQILGDVELIIRKLENRVNTAETATKAFIHFERQPITKGSEFFDDLIFAVKHKIVLRIDYQPFIFPEPKELIIHPYLLKEFRNRWFLFARTDKDTRISIFALDRIKKIKNASGMFQENDIFDSGTYFNHLIGVTIPFDTQPVNIEIKISKEQVPYILTKPIHESQLTIKENKDGSILMSLHLIINYELKSILLSYGAGIEVKKPTELREQIKELLQKTIQRYL